MSATSFDDSLFHKRLRTDSHKLFWIGLIMTALGIAALVFPMVATLAATWFVGWVLVISGGVLLVGSFSIHGAGPFFGALLFALLSIAAGVFLLFNTLAGEVALTLLLGLLFMVQGAFETFFALEIRPLTGWVGMLVSAILSIVIALLIVAAWPKISLVLLGVLLGVNFISSGIGYMLVARSLKS